MIINAVSACWSSHSYEDAVSYIYEGTVEPLFGTLSSEHVQLCPQHSNVLSEKVISSLMTQYPDIQFRLHSDVRLKNKIGITMDLIDLNDQSKWYYETLAHFSQLLNAPLYSLHAGKREDFSISELFDKGWQLQEIFNCPIAIEGHYPFQNKKYLIDSWKEYEQLYRSNLPYALDLSHLNIVAFREGWDYDLTKEMLASPRCKEIHISFNEGKLDNHLIAQEHNLVLWNIWKNMIEESKSSATIFSEGNQVLHKRKLENALKNSTTLT